MLWRSKKQSGQVAVSSGAFSWGSAPTKAENQDVNSGVGGQVANQDSAQRSTVSPESITTSSPAHAAPPPVKEREAEVLPRSFVVAAGYRVSAGAIISHRPFIVRGYLNGRSMSAGAVTIEKTGELKVASEVEILRVFGKVASPVKATKMVEVFAGGDVQDSLDTPSLRVAPGGRISGGHLVIGQS